MINFVVMIGMMIASYLFIIRKPRKRVRVRVSVPYRKTYKDYGK